MDQEEDLIIVRKKIIQLYSSSSLSQNKFNLFIKKLFHRIWLEDEHKNVVYYPGYINEINNEFRIWEHFISIGIISTFYK